ncbi:MAG: EAL domain-containing protein [Castellaniella sp.]|uniref:putative bifunctional diguanylate cyclase/phosphodiesterase n=1 Tax=Castellaniella sp. TaxID=1955812 RepID=UPI002A362482|nr:EAL domain-containing protein [Castellaniella sp.]MDY0309163.1 EAL domain-containing protein [Castellaniella sp.]
MFPLFKPALPLYVQAPGPDAALLPSGHVDRSHILALIRLGDYAHDAFLATDAHGVIAYMNRSAERLFGYRKGTAIGLDVEVLLPDIGEVNQRLRQPGMRDTLPWRGQGLDRQRQPLMLAGAVTHIPAPTGHSHLYVMRPRRAGQPDTDRQAELASLVYRSTSEGMLVLDPKGFILDVNPAFVRLRGRSESEVIGRHVRCLNSPCHDREFYRAMWRAVMETGSWQGEHWGQHANGELYPEWLSINTSYGVDDEVHRRVMIFSNIAEIKQAEAIIWKQANFDRLTDLPNRQMFHDRLEQSIRKSRRTGSRTGLLFLDLDRFKEINDTLGHAMGDELLKEAARRISGCVRQSDTVARLGGDEFTVLLDDIREPRDVERLARNILRRLAEPFRLGVETVFISTSIGITFYPDDAADAETLLNNADQAMYAAKAEGRNRSCYFTLSMQEQAQTRMRLVNDLHLALDQSQFSLDFQPIVDLASGRIVKAETLLRWHHPVRGLVAPDEFISLAEETGIIRSIGDWVFCEATRQLAEWRRQYGLDIQVSVNISPAQLRHEGLDHVFWRSHLDTLGLSPSQVIVEITEGLLIDSGDERIQRQLDAFHDVGMQVALDDFGTGYSSLSYLRKFNIDFLKIDQSFVANLDPDGPDLALCEAVILLAHKLGLRVVAEGIETREQYELLAAAGCDYGQGYLFARPLPPIDFAPLLANGTDLRPEGGSAWAVS